MRKEEEDCLRRHGIAIFSLVVNFGNLICIKSPPFLPKAAPKRKSWKQFFRFSGRGNCPAEARLERGKLNFFGALSGGKKYAGAVLIARG